MLGLRREATGKQHQSERHAGQEKNGLEECGLLHAQELAVIYREKCVPV